MRLHSSLSLHTELLFVSEFHHQISKVSFHPLLGISKNIRIIGSAVGTRKDIWDAIEFVKRGVVTPRVQMAGLDDLSDIAQDFQKVRRSIFSSLLPSVNHRSGLCHRRRPNMTFAFVMKTTKLPPVTSQRSLKYHLPRVDDKDQKLVVCAYWKLEGLVTFTNWKSDRSKDARDVCRGV
jgi:hypothetical protein